MERTITDAELGAYLDEALPEAAMAEMEQRLRRDGALRERLSQILQARDSGVHSVGDIWRRDRLSCPSREVLGSYLLQALMGDEADYITFHVETIGCRYCQSNLADLREHLAGQAEQRARRCGQIFQSSVGRLKK